VKELLDYLDAADPWAIIAAAAFLLWLLTELELRLERRNSERLARTVVDNLARARRERMNVR
jgi:type VI protein secretion system component VasF